MIFKVMRIVARHVLIAYWERHPECKTSLQRWYALTKQAHWKTTKDVQHVAPRAKIINADRARFEIAGGNHRLVVAFHFRRQIVFIKFIGTHAEYDAVDPLTVSKF
jgi:mRNA interferase HigB